MTTLPELLAQLDAINAQIATAVAGAEAMRASATAKATEASDLRAEAEAAQAESLRWANYADTADAEVGAMHRQKADIEAQIAALPLPQDKPADLVRENFNRAKVVNFYPWWNGGTRYQRFMHHVVLSGDSANVQVQSQEMYTGGGKRLPFMCAEYKIAIDGREVAAFRPAPGDVGPIKVDVPLAGVGPGYHIIDVVPVGETDESFAAYPFYRPGGEPPQWIPVSHGSYDLGFGAFAHKTYRIMWVPAKFDPVVMPLPTGRLYQHFSTPVLRSALSLEHIVPHRSGNNVRRPQIASGGEWTTQATQWYTVGNMVAKIPRVPLVDGPRGRGCVGYVTHLEVGTAAPVETGPINNLYGCTPWSVIKIRENGTVLTLGGYRHKQPEGVGRYWEKTTPADFDLVGDWSGIKPDRRQHRELWGMAWNSDAMVNDPNADRIPSERNLRPHDRFMSAGVQHAAGIEMVVADSQMNAIRQYKFSPISHAVPPVITEFIEGLNDPWDIVEGWGEWSDSYFISERKANRILRYDKNGKFVEVVVQGAMGLATIGPERLITRNASLTDIRAQPVCLPEGLYHIKDKADDWLYFASAAMGQVRRINLRTREIQVVQSSSLSDSSPSVFRKIAVSDGTFGPRGTIFVSTWSVTNYGFPYAFLPDMAWPWDAAIPDPPVKATAWNYVAGGSAGVPKGPGGTWDSWGYTGAVGIGNGRLVGGGANEGVFEVTLKLPGSVQQSATKYNAGAVQWQAKGYSLTHGSGGFGYYGLPLPWGDSPEIDYYLQCFGHVKP